MAWKKLQGSLRPNHKAACRMRIEGRSNADIAEALGVRPRTLVEWWCDEQIVAYLNELAAKAEDEFAARLAEAGMRAVTVIQELLDMPMPEGDTISAEMKLILARELMDRVPATAKNSDRRQDASQLVQIFSDMGDAQLMQFLNGASSGNGRPQLPPA